MLDSHFKAPAVRFEKLVLGVEIHEKLIFLKLVSASKERYSDYEAHIFDIITST